MIEWRGGRGRLLSYQGPAALGRLPGGGAWWSGLPWVGWWVGGGGGAGGGGRWWVRGGGRRGACSATRGLPPLDVSPAFRWRSTKSHWQSEKSRVRIVSRSGRPRLVSHTDSTRPVAWGSEASVSAASGPAPFCHLCVLRPLSTFFLVCDMWLPTRFLYTVLNRIRHHLYTFIMRLPHTFLNRLRHRMWVHRRIRICARAALARMLWQARVPMRVRRCACSCHSPAECRHLRACRVGAHVVVSVRAHESAQVRVQL